MKILTSNIKASYVIKKSRFLCFGYVVKSKNKIKEIIAELKKEYPDASHICYAYILDNKTFYYTDSGEPSGTAGKPIYGAIQSLGLNYTLFVVVRYFGGIKFGPGPLRSTFKDITLETLKSGNTRNCMVTSVIQVKVPYSQIKQVSKMFNASILNKKFEKEYVLIDLIGDSKQIQAQLSNLKIKIVSIKENQVV